MLIPHGIAHSGKPHTPEVHFLFVTRRDGSVAWSDNPAAPNGTDKWVTPLCQYPPGEHVVPLVVPRSVNKLKYFTMD
ncbi:MAG TPA: hypothetical protein VJR58_11080 [Vineibacter sp.]|nr:hypothetical protein [Vineibacter sp.]